MHLACIPPSLPPVTYLLRKGSAFKAGERRINESAIGIENVARFIRRELPHAAARNLNIDHWTIPNLRRT
jgi:hypothetical protein